MLEKSAFLVSPEDIPEEHSYHYANCFNKSLASSNNTYGTRQKYQMNFSVTGVLRKTTLISNSENKVFSPFSVGPGHSAILCSVLWDVTTLQCSGLAHTWNQTNV